MTYPQEFEDWVRRKLNAEDLARIAAACYQQGEADFDPENLIGRAMNLLWHSWFMIKAKQAKQDSLAKSEAKD